MEISPQLNEGSDLLLERTLEAPSVYCQLPGSGLFGLSPCGRGWQSWGAVGAEAWVKVSTVHTLPKKSEG